MNEKQTINKEIKNELPSINMLEMLWLNKESSESKQEAMKFFLHKVVKYIYKKVKKRVFEKKHIQETFLKRSAQQIGDSGETHYANPCFDYTYYALQVCKGFEFNDIIFVIDHLNSGKFHFGLEFKYLDTVYYIDFKSHNKVFIGMGGFKSSYTDDPVDGTAKIDGKYIEKDTPPEKLEQYINDPSKSKIIGTTVQKNFNQDKQQFFSKILVKETSDSTHWDGLYKEKLKEDYKMEVERRFVNLYPEINNEVKVSREKIKPSTVEKRYLNKPIIRRVNSQEDSGQ